VILDVQESPCIADAMLTQGAIDDGIIFHDRLSQVLIISDVCQFVTIYQCPLDFIRLLISVHAIAVDYLPQHEYRANSYLTKMPFTAISHFMTTFLPGEEHFPHAK
jgi:hypothetical protein